MKHGLALLGSLVLLQSRALTAPPLKGPTAGLSTFAARASTLDRQAREYPEIGFVFNHEGKPADLQHAAVDMRIPRRGELVIWMMAYRPALFDRLTSYGLHAIQPHYANKWFGKVCLERPVGQQCRGNARLEAATGRDYSDALDLQPADGMQARVRTFVHYLAGEHPAGEWDQFLSPDGSRLRWEKIILAGTSHGSTTSARLAKHLRVARVVMLCGPRDQYQSWQSLPSATPANRFFGFSHVLDGGWTADHYCRSWELLGLHHFGKIVNVDHATSPYGNTRRLITARKVAAPHQAVSPDGSQAPKHQDGTIAYEDAWRYLFTHPVEVVGASAAEDNDCVKDQRARDF